MNFIYFIIYFTISLIFFSSCSNSKLKPDPLNLANKSSESQYKIIDQGSGKDCLENRMALDIGSGSTKMLVARVNFCLNLIDKVYASESVSIKIKEQAEKNKNIIPEYILGQVSEVILNWKSQYKNYELKKYSAVGTEVFRQALNGKAFLKALSDKTQIKVRLISQKQEAKLGFDSALTSAPFLKEKVIVWDIGGGSMQMTALNESGQFIFQKSKTSSVSFKNEILSIKKSRSLSPNPLGSQLASSATKKSKLLALQEINPALMKEISSKKVLGIGGVHYKSIYRQINETLRPNPKKTKLESTLPTKKKKIPGIPYYKIAELEKLLKIKSNRTDAQIGGNYPETDVTNIALVLGYMQAFNINKVYVLNTDLTYGLILGRN